MEKDNFLEKLKKLVEVAKTKHNALDVAEINDFFMGDSLTPEQMEQIYNYQKKRNLLGDNQIFIFNMKYCSYLCNNNRYEIDS